MDKLWEWVNNKFQHPLSLLFFLLGVLLILLGVSTGYDVPVLKKLSSDASYRFISFVTGVVCCAVSILIYYRPPKSLLIDKATPVPDELKSNYVVRRASLSERQGQLLSFLQLKTSLKQYLDEEQIGIKFNRYSKTELFYRLEQLRLLGFLERQIVGQNQDGTDRFAYRISVAYKKELGDFSEFPPHI